MVERKKVLQSELRSRTKKRVFDKMWETYSDAFKKHYLALPRHERTKLVNRDVKMEGGKYTTEGVMEAYDMSETIKRSKEREAASGSTGVIQEVAEVLT